jgi:hypothetical protein
MSQRATTWLAWSLWALCVALAVSAVLLYFYTPPVRPHPRFAVLAGVPLLVYPTIGALVASRRPKNAVGYILLGLGIVLEILAFAAAYSDHARAASSGSLPGGEIAAVLNPWEVGPAVMLGVVLLVLLFPDGKLPHRALWAVVWIAVCGAVLLSLWWLTWPEGALLGPFVAMLGGTGGAALALSCVASVIAVFERVHNAEAKERQQLKWFGYGAAVFLGAFTLLMVAGEATSEWAVFVVIVTGLLAIPVAVGIAILRYRLYDIDVIINRTLVYGALTATLALIYFGGVAMVQAIFSALTGQEGQPQLAIVVSTLVIAALFNPLRRRIQSFIDMRFYRRKYDAAKTLEAFSAKLRDETDLDALSDEVIRVVSGTMQPAHVSLWLREPNWKMEDKGTHA